MGDLLKGPIAGIVEAVGGVLGKFIASPEDKLKAQLELTKIEMEFRTKVMEADASFAASQALVITEEAKSGNWLAASWRPILMLVFTYIIAHNFVIAPMFHLAHVDIPPDMWDLLRIGIGGYIGGRSIEKVTPDLVKIFAKK